MGIMNRTTDRLLRLTLMLAALASLSACMLSQGPPAVSPTKVFSMTRAPERGAAAIFAFTPINGVPSELLQTLTTTITKHAAVRHLNIVPPGDPTAVYTVKGYLSAIGDFRSTLLVYTWDVFDREGSRLRRISGQEIGTGASTDPWTGISQGTVAGVARSTVDELAAWSN
jgi:hypothetical protein